MNRSFLYLAVLTLLAVLLVVVFAPEDGPSGKTADVLLLPEISNKINDVDRVEIISAGSHTVATLVRTGDGWQIVQMGGYHANWVRLQALLAGLAQARVVEPKTDKPEYYGRLGVEDIAVADAGGVLVRVSIGDHSSGILIGLRAQGGPGQYVRLQKTAASALVDRELDVSTELLDWVDSAIIDISASEVAELEVIHPQGERVFVMRISADQTDFDLVGLPQGREIKNSWAVNSLGSVLSMLRMETVRSGDSVDWSDAVKMRLLMFSGAEIMADMLEADGEYLLRLHASFPAADVVKFENEGSVEQKDIKKQAEDDVAKKVKDINQKVSGWAYGISKQKFDAMVKQPEDLLKPLEAP